MPNRVFIASLALTLIGATTAPQTAPQTPPSTPAPLAPVPSAAPPPIEAFAELPFIESPELSPDGTRLAARVSIDGVQRFAVLPIGGTGAPALIALGDIDLNGWSWVNDDWLVIRTGGTSSVEGDDWYLRRALGVKADGSKIVPLGRDSGQVADDILWQARDGTPRILLAAQTSIYSQDLYFWPTVREYDVSTGKAHDVVKPVEGVMNWYADGAGTVRMGLSYIDERRSYRLLYRDSGRQIFHTINRAQGAGASLENVPALFLADPGKAVVFSDSDGFNALYDYDLTTQKVGTRLFGAPGYDVDTIVSDDGDAKLIGARYTDTRPRTHWFDPRLAAIQADIDKAVGAAQARIVSWNRDFTILIVQVGGGDRSGAFYIYRVAEGRMRLYATINEKLGRKAYAPVSTVRYTARDGLQISAVLTVPRDAPAKGLPLILMPHGGPAARDDESWDWWAQFLASRGYAVLQPNYRGSTGFGTDFEDKGKGAWGLAMQDDLTDAVHWATASGLADAKRVCIVGGSYGGYAALRAAQRDTGVYRCAVSFAGVSDMPGMLRYDGDFLNGGRNRDYLRAQATDLKGVSPINFAADFSIPTLLVHGKLDLRVPVKQSRDMAARLKAAGKPFRYVEQPKGDHHFSNQADRVQFLQELEAFLKANNPA